MSDFHTLKPKRSSKNRTDNRRSQIKYTRHKKSNRIGAVHMSGVGGAADNIKYKKTASKERFRGFKKLNRAGGKLKSGCKKLGGWLNRYTSVMAAFVAGVIVSAFFSYKYAFIWPTVAFVSAVILLFLKKKFRVSKFLPLVVAVFLGTSCFCAHTYFVYYKAMSFVNQNCTVTGTVSDILKRDGQTSVTYLVRVSSIENNGRNCGFLTPVYINLYSKPEQSVTYGDKIKFNADVGEAVSDENNLFDSNASKGCYLRANVDDSDILSIEKRVSFSGFFLRLRDAAADRICANMQSPQGEVVSGILFGKKDLIPFEITRNYNKIGIAHILAFSGLHVNILSLIILGILKKLKCRTKPAVVIMIACLFGFAAMAGFTVSAMRACIMAGVASVGLLVNSKFKKTDVLLLSASILLFLSPQSAVGLSFLLSFGSTLGILLFYEKLRQKALIGLNIQNKLSAVFSDSVCLTVSASILTFPALMLSFKQISIVSVLSNFLIVPCLPIIFVLGLTVGTVGFVSGWLASAVGRIASGFVGCINYVVGVMAKYTGYLPTYQGFIPLVIIGVCTVISLGCFLYRNEVKISALAILSVFIFSLPYLTHMVIFRDCASIDLVKSNFSESVIIRNKSGTVVVDCGNGDNTYKQIVNDLDSHAVRRIDALILTSASPESAESAEKLLNCVDVKNIVVQNSGQELELSSGKAGNTNKVYLDSSEELSLAPFSVRIFNYTGGPCVEIGLNGFNTAISKSVNSLASASNNTAVNVAVYTGSAQDSEGVSELKCGYLLYFDNLKTPPPQNSDNAQSYGVSYYTALDDGIGKGDY